MSGSTDDETKATGYLHAPEADQHAVVIVRSGQTRIRLKHSVDYNDANLESTASIIITAPYDIQSQLASALSWLCAAVRHSSHELPSSSHTIVSTDKSITLRMNISSRLGPITPFPETRSCWHALFKYTSIAAGFPHRSRENGQGLEISFANMINLARSLAFVTVNDGLVLDGLVTILYPVKRLPEDGAIQWHLEMKLNKAGSDEKSEVVSSVLDAMERRECYDWYETKSRETLINSRAFLGWVEEADLILGTKDMPMTVEASGARSLDPLGSAQTYGVSIGATFHGIGITGTASASPFGIASGTSGVDKIEEGLINRLL